MKYWFLYNLSNGSLFGAPYKGDVDEWTNIPDGCGVLGPIDEADETATDAWANPSLYMVQDDKLALAANADALKLADAQAAKKAEVSWAVQAKIIAGYQSTVVLASTGKAHFYGTDLTDQQNMTASRVYANANPTASISYRPQDELQRVEHTHDEFVQISDAVFNRVNAYLDQGYAYYRQIYDPAATVESVNAIVVNVVDPS